MNDSKKPRLGYSDTLKKIVFNLNKKNVSKQVEIIKTIANADLQYELFEMLYLNNADVTYEMVSITDLWVKLLEKHADKYDEDKLVRIIDYIPTDYYKINQYIKYKSKISENNIMSMILSLPEDSKAYATRNLLDNLDNLRYERILSSITDEKIAAEFIVNNFSKLSEELSIDKIMSFTDDSNKLFVIRCCKYRMLNAENRLILSLKNDFSKMEALEIIDFDKLMITEILSSFEDEANVMIVLEKYFEKFKLHEMAVIINNLKSDYIKLKFLEKIKNGLLIEDILMLIEGFKDDLNRILAIEMNLNLLGTFIITITRFFNDELNVIEMLDRLRSKLDDNMLALIISELDKDSTKMLALEKLDNKISYKFLLPIVTSLKEDSKKFLIIEKYQNKISSSQKTEMITEAIMSIRESVDKIEFLDKYFELLNEELLTKIISSFTDDEVKLLLLEKYFELLNEDSLTKIISSFAGDEVKLFLLEKYSNKLENNDNYYLIGRSFTNEELLVTFFEKYFEKFGSVYRELAMSIISKMNTDILKIRALEKCKSILMPRDIQEEIIRVKNVKEKIVALDMFANRLSPLTILDIIKSFPDDDVKIDTFQHFISKLQSEASTFICMLDKDENKIRLLNENRDHINDFGLSNIIQSFKLKANKQEYLIKYQDLLDGNALSDMLVLIMDDNVKMSLFEKNLEKFDIKGMCQIIESFSDSEVQRFLIKKYQTRLISFDDSSSKMGIIYKYFIDNNISPFTIESKERKIFNYLLSRNPHLLTTLDFNIFRKDVLNNDIVFIEKLSRYPEIARQIVSIYMNQPEIAHHLSKIVQLLIKNNNEFSIQSEIIFDYIKNSDNSLFDKMPDLNEKTYYQIIYAILNQDNLSELNNISELEKHYNQQFLNSSNDIYKLKDIYLRKFFKTSLQKAGNIIGSFYVGINDFRNDPANYTYVKYLDSLKSILDINNIETLKEIFYTQQDEVSYEQSLYINNDIKKIFNRDISNSLLKNPEPNEIVEINGKKIAVYEPKDDFKLLVHSTAAYGKLELLNDNYSDSWNKSSRTRNHGICCSYISNDYLGCASINDIMVGFDSFDESAIQLAAPRDIYSANDNFTLTAKEDSRFYSSQKFIDNTRFHHNEMVLERLELRSEKQTDFANIQPSYIIMFAQMGEMLKEKAIKASQEFNIPIVYLDREKIVQKEEGKITDLCKIFLEIPSASLLKEIVLKHENNRAGIVRDSFNPSYMYSDKIDRIIIFYFDYLSEKIKELGNTLEIQSEINLLLEYFREEKDKFKKLNLSCDIDLEQYLIKLNEIKNNQTYENEIVRSL